DNSYRMIISVGLPQQLSGNRIERIDVCALIAEVNGPAWTLWADADGCPHRSVGVKRPVNAACLPIERINLLCRAAHKNAPAGNCGLAMRLRDVRKSECPLQFQFGRICRRQSCHIGRLESLLRHSDAPPGPVRTNQRFLELRRGRAGAAILLGKGRRSECPNEDAKKRDYRKFAQHKTSLARMNRARCRITGKGDFDQAVHRWGERVVDDSKLDESCISNPKSEIL